MDARALGEAAGVQVGTLNAWIQRGFIPQVIADARGRSRDFDLETAVHVAIMVELVHFGFGAPLASIAAAYALNGPEPFCVFTHELLKPSSGEIADKMGFRHRHFSSERKLPEALANWGPGGTPSVYMVVNLRSVRTKIQQAEKNWQQRQARSTRKVK